MNVHAQPGADDRAANLIKTTLVWDSHAGFAYERAGDLAELSRWKKSGVDLVSVNIGYDAQDWTSAVEGASRYRHFIRAHPEEFVQVETVADVERARAEGKLAVSFDIEGGNALNGDPGMVDFYYRLGVRQLLFAYNRNNLVGGGCHDSDTGLTAFGREVVKEMNRVGMLVDCSHCGFRTSMEAMELSESPPIFSHSNARALCDHERNITDGQIKRCAERGGVIGITGVGLFLGERGTDPQHMVEHMDYMCQLVGPSHVGIGTDSVLLRDSGLEEHMDTMGALGPYFWPERQYPPNVHVGFVPPEELTSIVEGLLARGYGDEDIRAILGGNFRRMAATVWKPVGDGASNGPPSGA
jgi:membrane dipeptidase